MSDQRVPSANLTNQIIRDSYSLLGAAGAIPRLLGRCRPATVLGQSVTPTAVRAVVVNPLNGRPIWPQSHVFEKRGKGMLPVFADSDATSAIPCVAPRVRIAASLIHACPRSVLNRPPSGSVLGYTLEAITATTDHGSTAANASQRKPGDQCKVPTVTATYPAGRGALIGCSIHHKEAPVPIPQLINKNSHPTQYICDKNHVLAAADHA